jgi:hypothetical protein
MLLQVKRDCSSIPRLYLNAEMIHVVSVVIRGRSAVPPQRSGDVDEIDQRVPSSQLYELQLARASLDPTPEHIAVEVHHPLQVLRSNDHVVDQANVDRMLSPHEIASLNRGFLLLRPLAIIASGPFGGAKVFRSSIEGVPGSSRLDRDPDRQREEGVS